MFAQTSRSCCQSAGSYLSYAISTSGRRALTVLDVATDLRTFFLLWADPATTVVACFLLACLSTPFLVYWASAHNWDEAITAHKTFGDERPQNCRERCHRRFYNMVGVPLLGVYLTSVQIIVWWCLDIIMGVCCQRRHREELERLEQRKFHKRNRNMPLLMPPESAKYLTVVELFYESIPQSLLQLFVFFTHPSPYFKLQDVVISVGASLANTVLNIMDILAAARSRRMYFSDYLLYFMSGNINAMLESGVPMRRFLRNKDVDECDLTGFKTLYVNTDAMKNVMLVVQGTPVTGWKRVILPSLPRIEIFWGLKQFQKMVCMLLALRKNTSLHATLPDDMVPNHMRFLMTNAFHSDALRASQLRRMHCEVRSARCVNRYCGCCGTHPGDAICATNTRVLDDDLASKRRHRKRASCFRGPVVSRRKSLRDNMKKVVHFFENTFLQNPLTSCAMRGILAYMVVGDLELLYHVLRERDTRRYPHLVWFQDKMAEDYDGMVPLSEEWGPHFAEKTGGQKSP